MRVMVMIRATNSSEAGTMPEEDLLAEMGAFNEALAKAGVLLAGDGLHPSRHGKRVRFTGRHKEVIDGPFTETKELIAGYWIWQVKSMDEALEWARRCPHPMPGETAELEIRPVMAADDFGEPFSSELRDQEARVLEMADKNRQP